MVKYFRDGQTAGEVVDRRALHHRVVDVEEAGRRRVGRGGQRRLQLGDRVPGGIAGAGPTPRRHHTSADIRATGRLHDIGRTSLADAASDVIIRP